MNLVGHPHRAKRLEKVVKHYFSLDERWWDLDGTGLVSWNAERTKLRTASVFSDGHQAIAPATTADEAAERGYQRYKAVAESECAAAVARGNVWPADDPGRAQYVGEAGVLVIVADGHLVTAFRVVPPRAARRRAGDEAWERAAIERAQRRSGYFERAAVRRAVRRASLQVKDPIDVPT